MLAPPYSHDSTAYACVSTYCQHPFCSAARRKLRHIVHPICVVILFIQKGQRKTGVDIWILKAGKKVHSTFTPPPPGPSRDFPITGNLDVLPNQPEAQSMGSILQYQNDKQTATTTVANLILYRVQVSQSNQLKRYLALRK